MSTALTALALAAITCAAIIGVLAAIYGIVHTCIGPQLHYRNGQYRYNSPRAHHRAQARAHAEAADAARYNKLTTELPAHRAHYLEDNELPAHEHQALLDLTDTYQDYQRPVTANEITDAQNIARTNITERATLVYSLNALAARGYVRLIPNMHNPDTYQPLEEHTND